MLGVETGWKLKLVSEVGGRLQSTSYMRMSTTVLQKINGLYWVKLLKICQLWLAYSTDQINIVHSITFRWNNYIINVSKVECPMSCSSNELQHVWIHKSIKT